LAVSARVLCASDRCGLEGAGGVGASAGGLVLSEVDCAIVVGVEGVELVGELATSVVLVAVDAGRAGLGRAGNDVVDGDLLGDHLGLGDAVCANLGVEDGLHNLVDDGLGLGDGDLVLLVAVLGLGDHVRVWDAHLAGLVLHDGCGVLLGNLGGDVNVDGLGHLLGHFHHARVGNLLGDLVVLGLQTGLLDRALHLVRHRAGAGLVDSVVNSARALLGNLTGHLNSILFVGVPGAWHLHSLGGPDDLDAVLAVGGGVVR